MSTETPAAELMRKIRAEAAAEFEAREAEEQAQLDAWFAGLPRTAKTLLAAGIGSIVDTACAPLRAELTEVIQQRDEALDRLDGYDYDSMEANG